MRVKGVSFSVQREKPWRWWGSPVRVIRVSPEHGVPLLGRQRGGLGIGAV